MTIIQAMDGGRGLKTEVPHRPMVPILSALRSRAQRRQSLSVSD